MTLLLDTHILIWFLNGDILLSENLKEVISNISNKCYVSIASIWEIAIKTSLNKLELQGSFDEIINFLEENDIEILPITFTHLQTLLQLPYLHRDPFDRVIISQTLSENLTILTNDNAFNKYNIKII